MDKKDIYEHLAEIYLDASSKKRGGKAKRYVKFQKPFFITFIVACGITVFTLLIIFQNRNRLITSNPALNSEIALILQPTIVRMNFNSNPAKKEIYSIDLNKLDLSRFKALGFSARKANFDDKITLKVEFANTFKESSVIYIADLKSYKWLDYKINLSEFKHISEWSQMSNLSFIVEENGIVYIDNIRLSR